MGFNMLMGGSPFQELCGAVIGHLYYFLTVLYPANPANNGVQLLKTPEFFYQFFPRRNQGVWGRGQRLV